jgi:hypothetical protein
MKAKNQKMKYHDTRKLFGKEYFKSYFIKPKVHLSLSQSSNRFQSDIKKDEILSTKISLNISPPKINKYSQIIKISKNKTNVNYFKLVKDDKKQYIKAKILIKSIINNRNNNIRKKNDYKDIKKNNLSISNRLQAFDKKNNFENFVNNISGIKRNSDYIYNRIIKSIKQKQKDTVLKSQKNDKNNNNNSIIKNTSLFKNDRESKIKLKNYKNKNKLKNKNCKKLQLNEPSKEKKNQHNNNTNYNESIDIKSILNMKTCETNMLIKKIKINSNNISKTLLNRKNINENKSCYTLYKQKFQPKNNKCKSILKRDIKNILFNQENSSKSQSLYTQIFSQNNLSEKKNKIIKDYTNNTNKKNNINNYCYKNNSIDINNSNSFFKQKFFDILIEQKRRLKEEEFKKNMKEIEKNSNMRRKRYIELFNKINKSFNDIKNLIEQIEKEDLLKDVTMIINDDMSCKSILNNNNSISIEQKFKSIINHGLFNNKNGKNKSFSENTTSVINNDFSFEEDKKDIPLKSIDIKNNSIFDKNINTSHSNNYIKDNDDDNCFIL